MHMLLDTTKNNFILFYFITYELKGLKHGDRHPRLTVLWTMPTLPFFTFCGSEGKAGGGRGIGVLGRRKETAGWIGDRRKGGGTRERSGRASPNADTCRRPCVHYLRILANGSDETSQQFWTSRSCCTLLSCTSPANMI